MAKGAGKTAADAQPVDPLGQEASTGTELVQLSEELIGLTERERRFGQAYFECSLEIGDNTATLLKAYRRAFPLALCEDDHAVQLGRTLIRAPRVQSLVAHLRVSLSERAVIPVQRVVQELERVAFSNILDYVRVDPTDGSAQLDLRRISAETAASVREIDIEEKILVRKVEDGEEGAGTTTREVVSRRVKLKLYDKLSALDKLSRAHRLYRDPDAPWNVDDLDRAIQRMERELRERGALIDQDATDASHEEVAI